MSAIGPMHVSPAHVLASRLLTLTLHPDPMQGFDSRMAPFSSQPSLTLLTATCALSGSLAFGAVRCRSFLPLLFLLSVVPSLLAPCCHCFLN